MVAIHVKRWQAFFQEFLDSCEWLVYAIQTQPIFAKGCLAMPDATATIAVMSQERRTNTGKKPNRKPAFTLYARIKPSLGEAMDAFLEATTPRTSQSAVTELALEEFFRSRGFLTDGKKPHH
jgi:hypothetical protein